MKKRYKCGKCFRYVKAVAIKNPREEEEIVFVCKKCGELHGYEVEYC